LSGRNKAQIFYYFIKAAADMESNGFFKENPFFFIRFIPNLL